MEKTINHLLCLEQFDELVTELVLVNNNSNDMTENIMKSVLEKKAKVVYVFEGNPGLSNARLSGFNQTTGSWIAYIDDDNYLCPDWLVKLDQILQNTGKCGIVGGAIVPTINFNMTDENRAVLNKLYKSLACSHLSVEEIDSCAVFEKTTVVGAGMVIKRDILEELKKRGWLRLKGRTGKKMSAGEDEEICHCALSLGYTIRRYDCLLIEHDLPADRLTIDYAVRLMEGIYQAYYSLSGRDRKWLLRRLKIIVRMIHNMFLIKKIQAENDIETKLNRALLKIYNKTMWNNLLHSYFILKD